jgi:hypothetical protein
MPRCAGLRPFSRSPAGLPARPPSACRQVDADGNVDYYEWLAALMDWQNVQSSEGWDEWVESVGGPAGLPGLCGAACALLAAAPRSPAPGRLWHPARCPARALTHIARTCRPGPAPPTHPAPLPANPHRHPPARPQVFAAFSEGNGKISTEELSHLLCGGEPCVVPDTVPAALREFDLDHDDGISFDEFCGLLRQSRADRLELFDARRVERAAQEEPQG